MEIIQHDMITSYQISSSQFGKYLLVMECSYVKTDDDEN